MSPSALTCRSKLSIASLALVLLLFPINRLAAQSIATLTGTVTDQSGAILVGAKVVCRNNATNLALSTVTNGEGLFRIANVPVGSYDVLATRDGFEQLVQHGIELLTEHTVDLRLVMRVGSGSESVSVLGDATQMQTTTSDVQSTVDSRQMAELPLNGRNVFQLAALVPGAVQTQAGTIPGQEENQGLAVNGMRPTDTAWTLDGANYTNQQNGGAPTLPNPDTLQEFTVLTSNFSAETRGGGGVIKMTTRSGTNQLHGDVFEFVRNDYMDAKNYFDLRTEAYKQSQYGGTLGGPIRKDKLFYFGSVQGTNKRGSPNPKTLTVPTAAQRAGDFSSTGHTIVDPQTGQPFPNNKIPQSRWDSIGTKLLADIPLPNFGTNTLTLPVQANQDDYQFLGKIDYAIGAKDHLSGRYFFDRDLYQRDNNSLAGLIGDDIYRNQTVLLSEIHTFGPNWTMSNSFNYLRTFRTEAPVNPLGTMQALGANVQPAMLGVPDKIYVTLTGYAPINTPRGIQFNPQSYDYETSVSHAWGRHFIRFGGDVRHDSDYMLNSGDELGNWTFNATPTSSTTIKKSGDAIAGVLLGLPSNFTQSVNVGYDFTSTLYSLWAQDDWKIHPRLTLNLGMRDDPWVAPRLGSGVMAGFIPGAHSTVAPRNAPGIVLSGDPQVPPTIFHDHWLQLGPRAGFAWDIEGAGNTVLRGGYGIYQMGSEVFSVWRYFASAMPGTGASVTISLPPSTANPYQGYTGTIPFPFTPLTSSQLASYVFPSSSVLYALDPSYKPGYTEGWNLTFEHRFRSDTTMSLSYIGNHFLRALSVIKNNIAVYAPGATTTTANLNSRRPYQGIGEIQMLNGYNHGDYDGLQANITKRPARGLILQSSFTFSKSLDLNSSSQLGGALGQTPRNPSFPNLDKGPSDFDVTNSFNAMVLYDTPNLQIANRLLSAVMDGWQFNAIGTASTGTPFTCRSGVDNSFSGVNSDTCDQVLPTTVRPVGANPLQEWFNTAAFTENAIGTFGNVGRNTLRQPGAVNLDLAALKRIKVKERYSAELRLEAFNALNHPNWALINTPGTYTAQETVSSPTFGQVVAATSPRVLQVAMKVWF